MPLAQEIDHVSMDKLSFFVKDNDQLKVLSLKHLNLDDNDFAILKDGLANNKHLEKLILKDTEITDKSILALKYVLMRHPTLFFLSLANTCITNLSLRLLSHANSTRNTLSLVLDVAVNNITDDVIPLFFFRC